MVDPVRVYCEELEDVVVSLDRLMSSLFVRKDLRKKYHTYVVDFIHEELPDLTTIQSENCSICLIEISPGTQIKSVPCSHKFHSLCLLNWMYKKPTCPLCRRFIPPRVDV
nr:E3 ubiquitin-protein ligase RNF181-like [Onthophagus taurus]